MLLSWWELCFLEARGPCKLSKQSASVLQSLPLSPSRYFSAPPPSLSLSPPPVPFLPLSLPIPPSLSCSRLHCLCLPFPLGTIAPQTIGPTGCSSALPWSHLHPLALGPRLTVHRCPRFAPEMPAAVLLCPLLSTLSRGSDIIACIAISSRLRVVSSPLSDVHPRCFESLPPN